MSARATRPAGPPRVGARGRGLPTWTLMCRGVPVALGALGTVAPVATLAATAVRRPPAHNYVGRAIATRYGPVQVTITVSAGRMTSVGAAAPMQRRRSAQINGPAVVTLTREALRAQSASVHVVSGATITSRAFETSLASARAAAHLPR